MAKAKVKAVSLSEVDDDACCPDLVVNILDEINNTQSDNLHKLINIRGRLEDKWMQLAGYSPIGLKDCKAEDAEDNTLGKLRQTEEAISEVISDISQALAKFERL